ncbi:hypothetical protein FIBSPDRAFT_751150 [Athelia psychrophila]|uniref:Tf2-1-like SH3-like domain-containing protein n=1 Tax=Athelia psychrophila TaxID=1759441 RepID=A0A166DMA2_9AGAM|nr:hypothetical protein FIBSPDRAFT_751150 [Fibularhizoctonia sp. CBS 109695]
MPKFIGPYAVVKSHPAQSRYEIALPSELKKRRIHPTFHVSRLRPHYRNNDALFPRREVRTFYDFGDDEEGEWRVDEILAHQWKGRSLTFLVKWNLGDTTWELAAVCDELEALDQYLALLGVDKVELLPRRNRQ